MKHLISFCFLFLCVFSIISGQSDFRKGYIITNQNDTIEGYIDYKGSYKNLKNCRFKTYLKEKHVDYIPGEVLAFKFDVGNYFVAMPITINGKEEVLFIEKLVEGIADVYYYSSPEGAHFLIQKENGDLHELVNTRTYVEKDGKKYTKKNKEYLGILRILFQDSPKTLEKVGYTTFDPNSIINISEYYHNQVCTDYKCIIYSKSKFHPQIDFGIFAGKATSNIEFWNNDFIDELNYSYPSSEDFFFGGMFNFSDPMISERFSLQIEAIFQNASYDLDSMKMDLSYAKFPLLLKYSYTAGKIIPAIQLGVAYNRWSSFSDTNIAPEIQNTSAIQKRRYQYGIVSGLELSYKLNQKISFFIQGRYEYFGGRHYNTWDVYGMGGVQKIEDTIKSKTQFLNISAGVKF